MIKMTQPNDDNAIRIPTKTTQQNMKTLASLIVMTSLLSGAALAAYTNNFDDAKPGTAPSGWTATRTGKGEAKWTVEKDETAPSKPNVLKQSGEATYPVCLKNDTSLKCEGYRHGTRFDERLDSTAFSSGRNASK